MRDRRPRGRPPQCGATLEFAAGAVKPKVKVSRFPLFGEPFPTATEIGFTAHRTQTVGYPIQGGNRKLD